MAILETQPLNRNERKHRCEELLTQFGIEHVAKQLALTLSGGEKRRLTIARSLVTKPSLLMLDEPFSGVDPIAVYDVQQIIANLRRLRARPFSSPTTTCARRLHIVDRAYLIFEGRVVTPGRPRISSINDPVARQRVSRRKLSNVTPRNRRSTMQTANVNVPIKVTGRHVSVTEAIKDYARHKVEHLHLDYPRIIEAHVILDVEKHRHFAEDHPALHQPHHHRGEPRDATTCMPRSTA